MIYEFLGTEKSDVIELYVNNRLVAYCEKGQLLVDVESDYKSCDIIELVGDKIDVTNYVGYYFIPKSKSEEFKQTRNSDLIVDITQNDYFLEETNE